MSRPRTLEGTPVNRLAIITPKILSNRGFLYEPWPNHIWHREGTTMFYKNHLVMFLLEGRENFRRCKDVFTLDLYIRKFGGKQHLEHKIRLRIGGTI